MMTDENIADAGTNTVTAAWITIEGQSPDLLMGILHQYGVVIDQFFSRSSWIHYAHVSMYDPDRIRLDGYGLNDGTYISEVAFDPPRE